MSTLTSSHLSGLQRIIVYHLTQAPAVVQLLGERPAVIWGWGKDTVEATQRQPVINPQFRPGPRPLLSSPSSFPSLWIYAYSNRSQGEALRLYEALQPVLQGEGLTAPPDSAGDPCFDLCVRMIENGSPIDGYNPVAGAWFWRSSWRATTWGTG